AEEIRVDPGVQICVGGGTDGCTGASAGNDIIFDAVDKDNGLSILGITTTIPYIGTDGLVDISPDKGPWDSGTTYDAGDVVVGSDGNQWKANADNTKGGSDPGAGPNPAWTAAGTTVINGGAISLTAFAGSVTAHATTGQALTIGGNLTLDSVSGFADT